MTDAPRRTECDPLVVYSHGLIAASKELGESARETVAHARQIIAQCRATIRRVRESEAARTSGTSHVGLSL